MQLNYQFHQPLKNFDFATINVSFNYQKVLLNSHSEKDENILRIPNFIYIEARNLKNLFHYTFKMHFYIMKCVKKCFLIFSSILHHDFTVQGFENNVKNEIYSFFR